MSTDPHQLPAHGDAGDGIRMCDEGLVDHAARRTMVWLAVGSSLVFGAICCLLGLGVAKTNIPCPTGCAAVSMRHVGLWVMIGGPVAVSLVASALSLRALRMPHRSRPWFCALMGCLGAVGMVLLGSVMIRAI